MADGKLHVGLDRGHAFFATPRVMHGCISAHAHLLILPAATRPLPYRSRVAGANPSIDVTEKVSSFIAAAYAELE